MYGLGLLPLQEVTSEWKGHSHINPVDNDQVDARRSRAVGNFLWVTLLDFTYVNGWSDTVLAVTGGIRSVSSPCLKQLQPRRGGKHKKRRNKIISDVGAEAREGRVDHDTQIKFSSNYRSFFLLPEEK